MEEKVNLDGEKEILYVLIVIARLHRAEQFAPGPPTGGDIPRLFFIFMYLNVKIWSNFKIPGKLHI